jgi:hypothetical protein
MEQEDSASFVYAETPVEAKVHSSQRATPEEIVAIGKEIWAAIRQSKVAADDDRGNEALLEKLQAQYKDFGSSFPLVLRWMAQMRQFNAEALRKYLLLHAEAKLDSREGFLELQAEYLVLLYRETHPHPDEAYIKRYRASLVKQLMEEDKAFLALQKEVEEDLARQAKEVDLDRRQRLYEYLLAQKVGREQAGGVCPGDGKPSPGGEGGPGAFAPTGGSGL